MHGVTEGLKKGGFNSMLAFPPLSSLTPSFSLCSCYLSFILATLSLHIFYQVSLSKVVQNFVSIVSSKKSCLSILIMQVCNSCVIKIKCPKWFQNKFLSLLQSKFAFLSWSFNTQSNSKKFLSLLQIQVYTLHLITKFHPNFLQIVPRL
jgi:hypothetical protein